MRAGSVGLEATQSLVSRPWEPPECGPEPSFEVEGSGYAPLLLLLCRIYWLRFNLPADLRRALQAEKEGTWAIWSIQSHTCPAMLSFIRLKYVSPNVHANPVTHRFPDRAPHAEHSLAERQEVDKRVSAK